jgi:hypothetical protein
MIGLSSHASDQNVASIGRLTSSDYVLNISYIPVVAKILYRAVGVAIYV